MQHVEKYLSYFRYYKDEIMYNDYSWWYCILDNNVYETNALYEKFGYVSKSDICCSGKFIEFYKVDIIEMKREFLKQSCPNSSVLCIQSDKDFDAAFNALIETSCDLSNWFDYEQAILKSTLLRWCADNNIDLY